MIAGETTNKNFSLHRKYIFESKTAQAEVQTLEGKCQLFQTEEKTLKQLQKYVLSRSYYLELDEVALLAQKFLPEVFIIFINNDYASNRALSEESKISLVVNDSALPGNERFLRDIQDELSVKCATLLVSQSNRRHYEVLIKQDQIVIEFSQLDGLIQQAVRNLEVV
jgi:hypothetical protein